MALCQRDRVLLIQGELKEAIRGACFREDRGSGFWGVEYSKRIHGHFEAEPSLRTLLPRIWRHFARDPDPNYLSLPESAIDKDMKSALAAFPKDQNFKRMPPQTPRGAAHRTSHAPAETAARHSCRYPCTRWLPTERRCSNTGFRGPPVHGTSVAAPLRRSRSAPQNRGNRSIVFAVGTNQRLEPSH